MNITRTVSTLVGSMALLMGSVAVAPIFQPGAATRPAGSLAPTVAATSPLDAARVAGTAAEPAPGPFSGRVAARGRVEPASQQLELSIGLIGTLSHVYVDEGDRIHKGELLAELVNDDQRARVDEAAASVRLREAELDKLLNGARPEERRQVAAQLDESKARLDLAKREIDRQRPLAASGVASQQALDQSVSSLGVATAKVDENAAALALITAPPRAEDVAAARANLALAQANLDEQRSLLQKTELISPIDGVVLRRYLKTGETISIQPLIPILKVGDTSRLRVRAEIDETDVARVEPGQHAYITAPAYPGRRFAGVISRLAPEMGPKKVGSDAPTEKIDTKVLDVLIDLDPDPDLRLPIGLRVDVYVEPPNVAENSALPR